MMTSRARHPPLQMTRAPAPSAAPTHPVMLSVEEKLRAVLNRDGSVQSMDIKGTLSLLVTQEEAARCKVQMQGRDGLGFSFQTHPKVNKALYDAQALLQLKDAASGFPGGRPLGVLRWGLTQTGSAAEELTPLRFNCWPEEEGRGRYQVTLEYTLDRPGMELRDVRIRIPISSGDAPSVTSVDGAYRHDRAGSALVWEHPIIDGSNASGSLEFSVTGADPDAFFPIEVSFTSLNQYCAVSVASVSAVEGGAPIVYGLTTLVSTESYTVA